MPSRPTSRPTLQSNLSDTAGRRPKELLSTIVAVKSASERGRAELIRDVVDAYRRLYGSVQRFVLMLTDDQLNFASVGTSGSHSLNQLLSILAEQAKAAAFARLRDLKASIEEARSAEQLRDAIFSDAFSNDLAALRKVVAELERLDTAFIGLSVGHVLDQHARAGGGTGPAVLGRAAGRTTAAAPATGSATAFSTESATASAAAFATESAAGSATASATITQRKSHAERTLVHPND